MFQLGLIDALVADREREIQDAIRRRRLMKPEEAEALPASRPRRAKDAGALEMRARPTGG